MPRWTWPNLNDSGARKNADVSRDGVPDPPTETSQRSRRPIYGALAYGVVILLVIVGIGDMVRSQNDSDGDGLADGIEQTGWRSRGGDLYVTDPNSADTDADGLSDSDEAGSVVSGTGSGAVYVGVSDPTKVDTDGDGLNDKVEVLGWESTRGVTYMTKPQDADTDADGLTDAEESGEAVAGASTVRFEAVSNPLSKDTDGDQLSDTDEADLSLDAFERDTDGDGLQDGREADSLGTAPDIADTDGDGFGDGYEVDNEESKGLDPLSPDVKIAPSTYAWEFARGAVLGEIAPRDSLAWLAGNLASGGSSFIPGVGWVVGGAADIRDAVGSAIHADWVGAGFSVVGMLPALGDAAAIPAKTSSFVVRHPQLAPLVGSAIVALKWVPEDIKVATAAQITTNWD